MPEPTLQPILKHFAGFEIKDEATGEIEARVATLDVVDRDGDIIRRSAAGKASRVVLSSWGHDAVYGQRPVGKGSLLVDGGTLKFVGRVFLNTTEGRETFAVLKEMGADQEWSFGFRVLGSEVPNDEERKAGAHRIITKMDAFEVSPVLIGAGIGTRTLAVKAAESQADGDASPALDAALIATIAAEVKARLDATAKADADAAAEVVRAQAEATRQAEAKAAAEAHAAITAQAQREFERFRRTMGRVA